MPSNPKDSRKPAAPPAGPQNSPGAARQERLAQALRDNLKKRKVQQRAQALKRQAGQDDSGDDSQR
jgi:hypothetical protein